MRALDDQVRAGKILYLGVSDTPAWIVAQANTLAALRGWTPFAGLQVEYSLIERDVERELLPMARTFGMAVTPWSPLAGGILSGKYNANSNAAGRMAEAGVPPRLPEPTYQARPSTLQNFADASEWLQRQLHRAGGSRSLFFADRAVCSARASFMATNPARVRVSSDPVKGTIAPVNVSDCWIRVRLPAIGVSAKLLTASTIRSNSRARSAPGCIK